jgi:hypothetical protein
MNMNLFKDMIYNCMVKSLGKVFASTQPILQLDAANFCASDVHCAGAVARWDMRRRRRSTLSLPIDSLGEALREIKEDKGWTVQPCL